MGNEHKITLPKLSQMPLPAKLLCTAYLLAIGLGFLFAMPKIFLAHNMADGKPMLTPKDIVLTYYGDPEHLKIEQVLKISQTSGHEGIGKDADTLVNWAKSGAPEEQFPEIKDILDTHCVNCHAAGAVASSTPFEEYQTVKKIFTGRGGMSVKRLLTVSHTHMLGTAAVFMLTSLVVLFSSLSERKKIFALVLPFFAIVLDIGSWWLTAFVSPIFAYTVILGGALLGIAFLVHFCVGIYSLWLKKPSS